jgi:hypothetical protein
MPTSGGVTASPLWGNLITGGAAFIAAIGLVWTMGGSALAPIESNITKIERRLDDIDVRMATLLTLNAQVKAYDSQFTRLQVEIDEKLDRNVFDMSRGALADRIATLVATDDKAMDETLHQVHDLEERIVSREENVVHWNATDALALRVNALAERCKP